MAVSSNFTSESIDGNVTVDLHTNVSVTPLNYNSDDSLDVNFTHHVDEVGVDMQSPTMPFEEYHVPMPQMPGRGYVNLNQLPFIANAFVGRRDYEIVGESERNAQICAIDLTTDNDDIIDVDLLEPSSSDDTRNISPNTETEDECEFVLALRPPHLRTPELVSLSSETDSDVVFVKELKATNQNKPENNNENINTGASTSSGVRSSGRQRCQKNMNEQNKVKSRLPRKRHSIQVRSKRKNRPVDSDTSASFHSSSSSGESDHMQYEKYRLTGRKIIQRKMNNVKRSAQQNLQPAFNQKSKKRKVSSSDYSEEDEELLSELKKRLISKKSNPIENMIGNHSINNNASDSTVNMQEHFTETSSNPESYQRGADIEITNAAIILMNLHATDFPNTDIRIETNMAVSTDHLSNDSESNSSNV